MKRKFLLIIFLLTGFSHAQWSTSPYADSGLYVCPGFEPGIVTFEDGSSIVLGLLSSYIYAQKLDPEGYKMWSTPVLVFQNDSSDMVLWKDEDRTWYCTDGYGGVIIYWQDYRGAYYTQMGPKNNTTYIQRVDKEGNIRWGVNGIKVNNLEDGLKDTRITSDGEGGCALLLSETGFDYPNAPNKNYLKMVRYNSEGECLWRTKLDSSFSNTTNFQLNRITRGGNHYYFSFYKGNNILKRINKYGELNSYHQLPYSGIATYKDTDIFFRDIEAYLSGYYKISKLDYRGDTTWTKTVSFENFCREGGGQLLPDNREGVYMSHICNDSIMYFDSLGNVYYKKFEGIDIGGFEFPDGNNGIITYNDTLAKRFNSDGIALWQGGVIFLHDPQNAYSEYYIADNNGGLIVVYWSTIGGIFAQHTGRNGDLGIVTSVIREVKNFIPSNFFITQNYPNPFNITTSFKISVSHKASVKVKIFDILGRQLQVLINTTFEAGIHEIQWDASLESTGIYFYTLEVNGNKISNHKMLLTK